MPVQHPGHLREPRKVGALKPRGGSRGGLLGSQGAAKAEASEQEDSITFLTKEVEVEGGEWGAAPCMLCSWKDPMLSLGKDCSELGKGNRQKELPGRVSCSLPQGSGPWTSGTPLHPDPKLRIPLPVCGHIKAPRAKHTHLSPLCGTPIPFPLAATPNPRRKSAPTPRENKNLCYSITFWKRKRRLLTTNSLNC